MKSLVHVFDFAKPHPAASEAQKLRNVIADQAAQIEELAATGEALRAELETAKRELLRCAVVSLSVADRAAASAA